MALLNPIALWLLPLVAVLILLARLRPEPVRRAIATLHLWTEASCDEHAQASASRPRVNLLLILQIAFTLLVIAALARPLLPWSPRHVAIVVDTSASMSAREGNGTRLDEARRRAKAVVDSLPSSSDVRRIDVVDIDDAVQEFRDREVVVISDRPAPAAEPRVQWIQVGHPADNVAVTALAPRRHSNGASELLAEVFNYGMAPARVEIVFSRNGVESSRQTMTVEARRAATATLGIGQAGGLFAAELSGNSDALAADDRRSVVVRPAGRIHVRVDPSVDQFVRRALDANADVTIDSTGDADVVVCSGCSSIPAGAAGVLAIEKSGAPSGAPRLSPVVGGHPLLEDVDVAGVQVGNQPLLFAGEQGGRRIVQLQIQAGSSLPLTSSFPILIANAVDWLAAPRQAAMDPAASNVATETESDLRAFPAPADSQTDRVIAQAGAATTDAFALLLAVALAVFVAESWLTFRQRRMWTGWPWRAAVALLLLAAALGIRLPAGRPPATVVAVLDRSDSIGGSAREGVARINQLTAGMGADDRLGVVVFGGDAAIERRPSGKQPLNGVRSAVVGSSTNIEEGLRLARTSMPDGGMKRIVLISDGRETAGSALREAAKAAAAGVRVDVVPQGPSRGAIAPYISAVTAPGDVREAEPFEVAVDVVATPGARARVNVYRDGALFNSREVRADAGGAAAFALTDSRTNAGHVVYTAAIDGDDDDSRAGTAVNVRGQARLLYAGESGALAAAIESSGIRVTHVATSAITAAAAALAPYDALVLNRVGVDELTMSQAEAIVAYVDNGGGLLIAGSAGSLNTAAVAGSRLEPLLPIDLRPRGGKRAPSAAFVFVFDKSGSMADRENGVQKIELARQAVLRALDARQSSDPFGVIAFDRTPVVVAPLDTGRNAARIGERLRAIQPGGATAVAPAIELALSWLQPASTAKRHILLVSDGRTTSADAERLRTDVARGGVELSVIAIGPDADRDFLGALARSTGGRSYVASNIQDLPALAARDASATSGGTQVEETFTVRAGAHAVTAGLDRSALPQLHGYVVSALKPGSDAILRSHLDDPILAGWRFGLGRVAVFTSDLQSSWASSMSGWRGFRQLWGQTVRWTMRPGAGGLLDVIETDRITGPHLVVNAETQDGRFLSNIEMSAAVRDPAGATASVPVRATAPGRYEADLQAASAGAYVVSIAARDAGTGEEARLERAFYWNANRERAQRGVDALALAEIARVTGGEVLAAGANPFNEPRPWQRRDVSTWLALAALAVFFVDLARRRRVFSALTRSLSRILTSPRAAHA